MDRGFYCRALAVFTAGVLIIAGCGDKGTNVDTVPFEQSITHYLANKKMDMKVSGFKNVKVEGDQATATCSLKHISLPGPAVRWDFNFKKDGDTWTVVSHKTK